MMRVAKKEKPKLILAGFSAYTRELDYAKFVKVAKAVGALTMADVAHIAGLIAGKAHKNPFDYGRITSYNVCYTKLLRMLYEVITL